MFSKIKTIYSETRGMLRRLKDDKSGLAITELAFSVPIFMGFGMAGTETAFMAITNMKVSQAALSLADNASRIGQTDTGTPTPTLTDSDILQAFIGLNLQSDSIKLLENGRVILSSLEVKNVTVGTGQTARTVAQQFIAWQRCEGKRIPTAENTTAHTHNPSTPFVVGKPRNDTGSSYLDDANYDGVTDLHDPVGGTTGFSGMGSGTQKAQATTGSAVMFVEIEYNYQGLFGDLFGGNTIMRSEAAYNVRDDRNLVAGVNNDLGTGAGTRATLCSIHNATL